MRKNHHTSLYILLAGIALNLLLSCQPGTKKYDNIISAVKNQELSLGIIQRYKMEDMAQISTLKKILPGYVADRGSGKGLIWVYKTEKNLVVFIETEDDGHAGEYGVAYSETGETPVWNETFGGYEEWTVDDKINEHWWRISFRLG